MKSPKIPMILATWLLSIALAYTLGRSLQSTPEDAGNAPSQTSIQTQAVDSNAETASLTGPDESESDGLILTEARTPELIRAELLTALATSQNTPQSEAAIKALLTELAASNPKEALELAGQIESLRASEAAKIAILETWASTDPAAALAWAEAALVNEPSSMRNAQLTAIYRGYAQINAQAALQAAGQLSEATGAERRLKSRLMSEVIETQIENGELVAAKQSIELMDDGYIKSDLMREMIDEWATYDPQAAAEYVESLGPDADTRLKTTLIEEWAENDPAAAAAWLESLDPDDPARSRAAAEIIREWARYDLSASAEWLNTLPASPELDRAVASYTYRAVQEDPATAMTWAESVTNNRMKGYLQQRVAGAWKEEDPYGFQDYLDNSELSDEQKEKLLNSNAWGGGRGPGGGQNRQ